jgi:hypothetical protein
MKLTLCLLYTYLINFIGIVKDLTKDFILNRRKLAILKITINTIYCNYSSSKSVEL